MAKTERELTVPERRSIRKLVTGSCANYDRDYGCLPLDCECPMLGMFDLWCQVKRGLKNNTFENYKYMYNLFVRPNFGKAAISMSIRPKRKPAFGRCQCWILSRKRL